MFNAPGVVSVCHMFFVLAFILNTVIVVAVAGMSFIYGSVTVVCRALFGFIMAMYMYMCMCVCVYIYVCLYVYVYMCIYIYMYVCVYVCMYVCIYIYPYFIVIVVFVCFY